MKDSRCHWFSSWKCDNYSEFQLVGTVSFKKKKRVCAQAAGVWRLWVVHSQLNKGGERLSKLLCLGFTFCLFAHF